MDGNTCLTLLNMGYFTLLDCLMKKATSLSRDLRDAIMDFLVSVEKHRLFLPDKNKINSDKS